MTTHYIEEAERLCDRVAIIDNGRIIAQGSPRELQERVMGKSRVEIVCAQPLPEALPPGWGENEAVLVSEDRMKLSAATLNPAQTVVELVSGSIR